MRPHIRYRSACSHRQRAGRVRERVRARQPGGHAAARPWPRGVDLGDAQVLVYQPQINSWTDNQLDFRAALAIKPAHAKAETFGVIFATTRTQVDKVLRTVTFENLQDLQDRLPDAAQPRRRIRIGAADPVRQVDTHHVARPPRVLARARRHQAADGRRAEQPAVDHRQLFAGDPGADRRRAGAQGSAANSQFQRVINTRALILQGGPEQNFYIHVYDGWLASSSITGPWAQSFNLPPGMDSVAQTLAASGAVDMLDGGAKANPKPSLANGVPTIYTSQVPAELIVFKGQPDFQPVVGTQLLWAANTTSDVLIDISNNHYYVLISGRWFDSAALTGPWTFVPNDALAARLRAHPAAIARRRGAADRGGYAAGARGGDLQFDSADGDRYRSRTVPPSRRTSTGRRNICRSTAHRSRMSRTPRSR